MRIANGLDNQDGTTIRPGDRLDHYQVNSVASEGRLAITFRATDLNTNQTVAIEVPRPEIQADPVLSERFQRDADIDQSLKHPGLIRLIEKHGGPPGHEPFYLVREWFEGTSLRELLSKGKLAPERAVRITTSICEVAEYVHANGIVLRELEPEHILIGENDEIKIIHIGVSSRQGARRLTFTKLSQLVGSSRYISPEELKGRRADARSDIYSIGIMLYEMLTGMLPFHDLSVEDRLTSYPVPPREIDPGIPPQLQEVIYRAIESEPHNRYKSAHDVASDIQHLDQVVVMDRPEIRDWRKSRGSKFKTIATYVAWALIPIAIFGLMLYFARR